MLRLAIGAGIVIAVIAAVGGTAAVVTRGGGETDEAIERFVHMCLPDDQDDGGTAEVSTSAGETATPAAAPSDQIALFYQNSGAWHDAEYARSTELPPNGKDWCGTTIAQCGCAMTSVANILTMFQITADPEGRALDPGTLNDWLNRDAEFVEGRGWISAGYFLGNIIWSDVQPFTARLREIDPSLSLVRYRGVGTGSEEELRAELAEDRPVVLEVPGHFIAAIAIEAGTNEILIHDPYYPDRTHLSQYPTEVLSSRLFERVVDGSAGGILITASPGLRVEVTDSDGNVVGTLDDAPPQELVDDAENSIPGASYTFEAAFRDPTCIESDPPPDAGATTVYVPSPDAGDYRVRVVDAGGGGCVGVYRYAADGTLQSEQVCGDGDREIEVEYDPGEVAAEIGTVGYGGVDWLVRSRGVVDQLPAEFGATPGGDAPGGYLLLDAVGRSRLQTVALAFSTETAPFALTEGATRLAPAIALIVPPGATTAEPWRPGVPIVGSAATTVKMAFALPGDFNVAAARLEISEPGVAPAVIPLSGQPPPPEVHPISAPPGAIGFGLGPSCEPVTAQITGGYASLDYSDDSLFASQREYRARPGERFMHIDLAATGDVDTLAALLADGATLTANGQTWEPENFPEALDAPAGGITAYVIFEVPDTVAAATLALGSSGCGRAEFPVTVAG